MEKARRKNNYAITLLCIVLIVPFLSIVGVKNQFPETVYQTWQTIAMIVFLTLLIVKSRGIQLNWTVCLFGIYQGIILLSSTVHNGFSSGMAVVIINSVMVFALLQTDCYYEMLSAIGVVVVGSMLINFPIMLSKSGDTNAAFFIGGKNSLGTFLVPGIFLLIISSLELHNKITKPVIAAILFGLLTIFLGSSSTGIVVALCALLFGFISTKYKPKKSLYLGILITVYILFLLFSESFFLTEIWLNFTDMLGKDGNLTSRTEIWAVAKDLIKDNLWIGVGRGAEIEYINSIGRLKTMYEAHNFVLETLFEGGIAAFLIYSILFIKAVRPLNMDNKKHRLIFVALIVILINGLTESVNNSYLVITILGVACRYATEEKNKQRKELWARQRQEMQERQTNELRRVRRWRNG